MTLPAESPRSAAPAPAGRSLIAADVTITGDIGSEGTVEIMGRVEGKIAARTVVLGIEGSINGSIAADTVELRGNLSGKLSCASLILRATAQVHADVTYQTVSIESGAQIEGRFTRAKT